MMQTNLQQLKDFLKINKIPAFLIPINDEFFLEEIPPHNARLKWLTGFTGSAGLAIVTETKNIFFTDGRYILQAEQELNLKEWIIYNIAEISPETWLKVNQVETIYYDPQLITINSLKAYKRNIIYVETNPIDILWKDRKKFFPQPITLYSNKYAGKSSLEKVQSITLKEPFFLTDQTSICWLTNVRGNDLTYSPLAFCYALLYPNQTLDLFLYTKNYPLLEEHIRILPIEQLKACLQNLSIVQVDPQKTSQYFVDIIGSNKITLQEDPCDLPKACKNKVEIENAKIVHLLDGIAVTKFIYWLKHTQTIDEITAASKLLSFRQESALFQSPSFKTISAFGPNAAIVHYAPTSQSNSIINNDNLYLIDSGGQYLGGTTDITRTLCLGEASYEQKLNYTLVLKGLIALSKVTFPKGTNGKQLDVLARYFLWQQFKDFKHGTGHGVGNFLGVHEGPQSFSNLISLQEGMILSNEPGYYEQNKYGIRIENLMYIKSTVIDFLNFETLTLVPLEIKLILSEFLSLEEREWIKSYHIYIYDQLKSYIPPQIGIFLEQIIFMCNF